MPCIPNIGSAKPLQINFPLLLFLLLKIAILLNLHVPEKSETAFYFEIDELFLLKSKNRTELVFFFNTIRLFVIKLVNAGQYNI